MNLTPLHNIVIVEKEIDPQFSAGGIKLARVPKFHALTGKVLAVGPGMLDDKGVRHSCNVKVGDRVVYDLQYQRTFDVDGEEVVMVKANGIFGKVPTTA